MYDVQIPMSRYSRYTILIEIYLSTHVGMLLLLKYYVSTDPSHHNYVSLASVDVAVCLPAINALWYKEFASRYSTSLIVILGV